MLASCPCRILLLNTVLWPRIPRASGLCLGPRLVFVFSQQRSILVSKVILVHTWHASVQININK